MSIDSPTQQDPLKETKLSIPYEVFRAGALTAANQADQAKANDPAGRKQAGDTGSTPRDVWKSYEGNINPLGGITENPLIRKSVNGLDTVIGTLRAALDVLGTVGKLLNVFQSDLNSLFTVIDFALQSILEAIKEIAVSLSSTGVYVLPLFPEINVFDPGVAAGGGFKEAKAKINHALTNRLDPNRPVFFEGDYLGAVIILASAGTNAGDLLNDLTILSRFFDGDEPGFKLSPVRSLVATPGLYYKTEDGIDGLGDVLSAAVGQKFPAIKVTWGEPEGIPGITGYRVYRSKSQEGTPELDGDGNLKRVPSESPFNAGKAIYKYSDLSFNGGEPVFIKNDYFSDLEYTDFEVTDGEVYFYKVVPLLKASDGRLVEGEVISQYVSAKASSCIPSDLLAGTYETPDGLLRGKAEGDPPYWSNLTLRGLLGENLDTTLRYLQSLADRLKGVSVSSAKHFDNMLETLEDWVSELSHVVGLVKNVLESLQALQFSSSSMMLSIPAESGGIAGLIQRINNAGLSSELQNYLEHEDNNCTLYGGLVMVVGSPTGSSLDKLAGVTTEELARIKKAGKFEKAKAQFSAERAGLKDKSGKDEAKVYQGAEQVMSFLTGLFGG